MTSSRLASRRSKVTSSARARSIHGATLEEMESVWKIVKVENVEASENREVIECPHLSRPRPHVNAPAVGLDRDRAVEVGAKHARAERAYRASTSGAG